MFNKEQKEQSYHKEFLNNVALEIEKELATEYYRADRMPGNIYHLPVILKNTQYSQPLTVFESESKLEILNCQNCIRSYLPPPAAGSIRDARIQGSDGVIVGRKLLGYTMISRMKQSEDIEYALEQMRFIIKEAILDIREQAGAKPNDRLVGDYLLKFIPNDQGQIFRDLEGAAAYEIFFKSRVYRAPPEVIDCSTVNAAEIADYAQFGIKVNDYARISKK